MQEKPFCVLYLENDKIVNCFDSSRLRYVDLVLGQVSISIENSRLFHSATQMQKSYRRFLPQQFLAELGKTHVLDVSLGDSKEEDMCILFVNIRNFASVSSELTSIENFSFMNDLLRHLSPTITDNRGFIDKFIGA